MKSLFSPAVLALMLMAASPGPLSAGALFLDGNGDYVTFLGTGIPSGGQSFTIEAWINPTTIPTGGENGGQITFWGNESGNQANGFRLRGASGTRHFFWGNDHDANFGMSILPDTTGANMDGWHHLALTYNGTQTIWYWNGVVIGTRQTAAGVNVAAVNYRIGARPGGEFFHGFIDEIRIWNKARSSAEINAEMGQSLGGSETNLVAYFDFEGNFADRAGGDNNGTPVGDALINPTASAPIQTTGPRIFSFAATTNWVMIGTPATLSWYVTNFTSLFVDNGVGFVTGTNGSVAVTPFVTTTYTLTASNETGIRTALVTITVDPGVPVAYPQSLVTIRNTPRAITLTASDPNGNTLTFAVVAPPQNGGLTGTPPNVTYTPALDFVGSDFLTFKVNDGTNDSAPATISIRVDAEPTPPSAIILSTTNINPAAAPGALLAALRAIDANPLDTHTFALVPGPGDTNNGLFTINGNILLAGPAYNVQAGAQYSIRLRVTDSSALTYEEVLQLTAVAAELNIVINEIHYNSPQNTIREEFIELLNPRNVTVDLSNWRLAGGVDFAFPAGTSLAPGAFLVVAQAPATLTARYGVPALGPWSGQLNNEGEQITLRDALDNEVDTVDYRSVFPWPIAPNGGGSSMELIHPALDNDLGSSWAAPLNPPVPSPGRTNQVFAFNAAPNIRQVDHTPRQPLSPNAVTITAKVTDPEGVASVVLRYQVVLPGNFIPATLPLTTAQLNNLNNTPTLTNQLNPVFEAATNWTAAVMHDDGLNGDAVANDSIYTVVLPPQANRTLVRYRITVTDTFGATRRAPFQDDPALNFAYFVYDGIPAYQGVSSAILQTLPVYSLITRDADLSHCTAWFNSGDQLPQASGGSRNTGRLYFNWEGAVVYDGVVYDHVTYRLRGANGRYHSGKRSFRIRFNDGQLLEAKDQFGNRFPTRWRELTTGKGQSNRGSETFAMNEVVNYFLWNKVGVPAPMTFHFHFRVIRGVQESPTDPYAGDFWGLNWAQEKYDVNFLDAHGLPQGNLYKLVDNYVLGVDERRYQAPLAVTNAQDFMNIENNLTGLQTRSWLEAHANYTNWYRYFAIAEAIRHYDVWPSANKNGAWYFEPIYTTTNNFLGRMMTFPYDSTDTWGPTWNSGPDVMHNGIFNDSGVGGGDAGQNLEMQREFRNVVREVRDLLFQPDQIVPIIDAFAARVLNFSAADYARWRAAPAPASYNSLGIPSSPGVTGGLAAYVQDMKNFMFVGGNNTWWVDRNSVGAGGWVTRLDTVASDATIPNRPALAYAGPPGWPVTDLIFQSSGFSDPQGAGTFAAIRYRVAEVQDTNAPVADARQVPPLEWDATWDSGELAAFTNQVRLPSYSVVPGRLYRARVRHKDLDGNWSSWSAPVQFKATPVDVVSVLQSNLVISEIMYRPPTQGGIDGDEFEFLELQNTGSLTLDLSGLSFTAGFSFTFTNGTLLAPGRFFVLGRNPAQLQIKYPGLIVNGVYGGRLDNNGETLTLTHPHGTDILSVSYSDRAPWPVAADGYGFSLVLDPASPVGYRASSQLGGSPGATDPSPSLPRVVINEILSNSDAPALDAIELYNPTTNAADIGGWFLTDDATYPWKYRIADGTVLAAGSYLVFDESYFNANPSLATSFALSSMGDQVYLLSGRGSNELTGYSHSFVFGGAARGETFGRYINSVGAEQFPPQIAATLGTNNTGPRVGPVVITKINYHPKPGGDEFVELLNLTNRAVPLFDPANATNTWKLAGLGYAFPTNVTLEANGLMLLVATDPADFRAKYSVPAEVQILGPYAGALQNDGERLELQSPDLPTTNGTPYFTVDGVRYSDRAPWPTAADGHGAVLRRRVASQYGDDPGNWAGVLSAPGVLGGGGGVAPTITTGPVSQAVVALTTPSLSVVAGGDGPLTYQWLYYGTNLPGATNATLTFSNILLSQAGSYSVYVLNTAGSVLSTTATLTVLLPVSITLQPQTVRTNSGSNVVFTVAAVGNGPITYQWRFNGVPIAGATATSLSLTNVQLTNDGAYDVLVNDAVSSAVSQPALLIVLVKPVLVQQPTPTNQIAALGDTVSISLIATGRAPLSFRWRKNNGAVALTNIIAGDAPMTFSNLLLAVVNGTNCVLTVSNVQLANAGNYDVVVTNAAGATTPAASARANLTAVLPPTNQVVAPGSDVTFRAVVSLPPNLTNRFVWQFNDTPLKSGTNATGTAALFINDLVLTNVTAVQNGNYTFVFTNSQGVTAAYTATLEMAAADSDGDGIPDWWTQGYFGHPTGQAGDLSRAGDDADGDGMSNGQEYQAGTDPTNALSVLKIAVQASSGLPTNVLSFQFTAMSNKSYSVQFRNDAASGGWSNLFNFDAVPTNRAISITNALPEGLPRQFYRVRTPQAP